MGILMRLIINEFYQNIDDRNRLRLSTAVLGIFFRLLLQTLNRLLLDVSELYVHLSVL